MRGSFVLGEMERETCGPSGEVVSSMESVPMTMMRKGSLDSWMEVRIVWALDDSVVGGVDDGVGGVDDGSGVVGVVFSEEEDEFRMWVLYADGGDDNGSDWRR